MKSRPTVEECQAVERLAATLKGEERRTFKLALLRSGLPEPNGRGDTLSARLAKQPRHIVLQLGYVAEVLINSRPAP